MGIRLAIALAAVASLHAQNIFTVVGIPYTHRHDIDGIAALKAPLGNVYGLLIDQTTGRLLFDDPTVVARMEPDGTLLALAGVGYLGSTAVELMGPSNLASDLAASVWRGMAEDSSGNLYLADAGAGMIYRVAVDGTFSVFAGPAPPSPLAQTVISPRGMVFDSQGNLDFADAYCNCIRQAPPTGAITTHYNTLYTLPGSTNTNVEALIVDAHDNLYFTTWLGNQVWRLNAGASSPTLIAGTGVGGFSGDGGPAATAQLNGPSGLALDSQGNLYISDSKNNRIRVVAPNGTISTFAGDGICDSTSTRLCQPAQILFDSAGNLLVADYKNSLVRRIEGDGTIDTIAGSGQTVVPGIGNGDGGPPIHATFGLLGGIAFDPSGNLYASDTSAATIRKITPAGEVSTIAGNGIEGYSGDGGPALDASFINPGPLAFGPDGALYIISGDDRIRKITPDGNIALVAGSGPGTGLDRARGDGGPAVDATLNEPAEVAFDHHGDIFIADSSNARIRKIDTTGIITTVAGPTTPGTDYFNAVALDAQDNLYLAWTHGIYATVDRVNPDASFTRLAGSGVPCAGGPPFAAVGPGPDAILCAVTYLTFDPAGLLNFTEGFYATVLGLSAGNVEVVAGDPYTVTLYNPSPGDGGPVTSASLAGSEGWSPNTIAFDPQGNMYLSEPGLNVIRMVTTTPYMLSASPASLAVSASTQTINLSANFAEPFPYQVKIDASWLTANRASGLIGEPLQVKAGTSGLAPGVYTTSIRLITAFAEVDVPATLTVP